MSKAKVAVRKKVSENDRSRNGANGSNGSKQRLNKPSRRRVDDLDKAVQRYANLYEFAPVGYVSFDRTGRIQQINLAATRLLEQKRDNLIGGPFSICVEPKDLSIFLQHLVNCRTGNRHAECNLRLKKRGGGSVSVLLSSTPTHDVVREGVEVYQTAIVDLTDREQAEQALRRSEERYRSLFDLVPVAVYACDATGAIHEYNRRAVELWGQEPKQNFCGSYKIYHSDGRPMPHSQCPMARALRGEKLTPRDLEIIVERPNGERRHVLPAPKILTNSRGKIVGAINCLYDVTERKLDEQRLAEQARLLDLTYDAIIVRDADDRISYWNRGAEELYGYTREQAIGKVLPKLLKTKHPEPHSKIVEALHRDKRWEGELVHSRSDGTRLVTFSRWSVDTDTKGKPRAILETNNDITARKRIEQSLGETVRQQETLYQFVQRRGAAESLQEIYSIGLDTILETLRCDRASILILDDKKVMRFVDSRGLSAAYRKAVEGHSPWSPDVKNPEPVLLEDISLTDLARSLKKTIKREGIGAVAFIPLVSERKLIGKIMAYYDAPHVFSDDEINVALNIGGQLGLGIERKRAEAGLRESEERLRAIVEQATAGMVRTDLNGRVLFVNQTFCQILGYGEKELIGKRIEELTYSVDAKKTMKLFGRLVKEAKPYEIEKRYVRKDGSIIWVSVSASPIRAVKDKVTSAVAVVVDITARKRAEAALRRSKQLLEKLVQHRTKALRLANVELESEITRRKGLESQILEISDREQQRLGQELHDGLCQQLTAIAFMARAASLRLKDHRVVEVEQLEKIAQLINGSVMDARNIARDLHKEEIDAASFETALRDLADRKIWKTPCRLMLSGELNIEDDNVASQLYRILREGVINANKHARATDVVIEISRKKKGLVFSVTDNGVGLHRRETGHGLGFRIMQYRAESIGARLELESGKSRGTRLLCYLPQPK